MTFVIFPPGLLCLLLHWFEIQFYLLVVFCPSPPGMSPKFSPYIVVTPFLVKVFVLLLLSFACAFTLFI